MTVNPTAQRNHDDTVSALRTHSARVKSLPRVVRILVVDDEPNIRSFVDRVLQTVGYLTTAAEDGADALTVAEALGPFDMLLTDLRMPRMNGDELARRLRDRQPDIKILYLTGFCDHLFEKKAMLWEDEAFLEKPCTVRALLEAVSLLLHGRLIPPSPEHDALPGESPGDSR